MFYEPKKNYFYLFFFLLRHKQAALGIANLLIMAMIENGIEPETAYSKIWLMDSHGLVTTTRDNNDDEHKKPFAKDAKDTKDLLEIVNMIEPTCLFGILIRINRKHFDD